MPWTPDPAEGYRLYENQNDGSLRLLRNADQGPWRLVSEEKKNIVLTREAKRQTKQNEFVGKLRGKTLILFGSGPMLTRFKREQLKWLIDQEDIVIAGVNALPAIARNIWGVDPDKLFEFIFAADAMSAVRSVYSEWGWQYLNDTPVFSKYQHYDDHHFPIVSSSSPSLLLPKIYWRDSIVGAINLACIMMMTPNAPKVCGGPHMEWPIVSARDRSGRGSIVLVGLEYNRYDHVFTHDEDFDMLPDRPKETWTHMDERREGHRTITGHAADMGIAIFNAAPWSLIEDHEFVDFEKVLGMPEELRTGITSLGEPKHGEAVNA